MSTCDDGHLAKKLKTDCFRIETVLSDEYSPTVQFDTAIACDIVDKRATSKLARQLSLCYPLPCWSHLKRVTLNSETDNARCGRNSILICSLPHSDAGCGESVIPSKEVLFSGRDVDIDALSDPYVVMVPRRQPLTRSQFEICRKHWSTAFHEDKYITRMMSDEIFSKAELSIIKDYIIQAVNLAVKAHENGGLAIGCLVVDPVTNSIVAKATDLRHVHPLQHAVMMCIDAVAKQQGGGAWKETASVLNSSPISVSCNQETNSVAYLSTGFDVYISREPCVMCAMGLLHSRVRRVFYQSSYCDGALGSRYKLHTIKSLNHHFEVFKVTTCQTDEVLVEDTQPT